jgi:hypothetical protein
MKTIILTLLLAISFISCNTDDVSAQVTNTEYKQVISNELIGTYTNHSGEVEGDIIITSDRIIINTSTVFYDIDLTKIPESQQRLWCQDHIFEIWFTQYDEDIHIKISDYLRAVEPHITISIDNNVLGNFDPVIKEIPQEPETPIHNNSQNN